SALERLTQATDALRNTVGQLRLTRFEACWPSLVRDAADAAAAQGRAVGFLLDGGHLPVERDLLDAIREPLGRVIAHAAAKAIETPETRRAAGKPERAAIRVSVERDERVLRVAVADDGAGRGLGREVDTSSLVALGGAREVSALLGRGTTVRLRVPLPKTVEPAFVLACGDLPFLVPQVHVRELLVPPQDGTAGIEIVGDGSDLLLPGRRLPLVRLDALVSDETAAGVPSVVAVVEAKGAVFALSAEAVAESQDVVVAPLSPFLRDIPFLSGAALLGDGRSALMLDVDALAAAVPRAEGSVLRSAPASGETMDLLRFQDAGDTPMAIPVAVLARLESVEPSQLDYLDGRPLLRSPTGPIPLLAMNGMPKVSEGAHPVLIVAAKDRPIGLVVDRILDIQRGLVIRGETGQGPGIFGSALLGGRRTSVVDAGYLTSLA
ncbi:MAG: chemotaxis protein CheW, partial [Alphaproteobacteria bacterium]